MAPAHGPQCQHSRNTHFSGPLCFARQPDCNSSICSDPSPPGADVHVCGVVLLLPLQTRACRWHRTRWQRCSPAGLSGRSSWWASWACRCGAQGLGGGRGTREGWYSGPTLSQCGARVGARVRVGEAAAFVRHGARQARPATLAAQGVRGACSTSCLRVSLRRRRSTRCCRARAG